MSVIFLYRAVQCVEYQGCSEGLLCELSIHVYCIMSVMFSLCVAMSSCSLSMQILNSDRLLVFSRLVHPSQNTLKTWACVLVFRTVGECKYPAQNVQYISECSLLKMFSMGVSASAKRCSVGLCYRINGSIPAIPSKDIQKQGHDIKYSRKETTSNVSLQLGLKKRILNIIIFIRKKKVTY